MTFDIHTWYQQPLGSKIIQLERQQLMQLPKTLFGNSILQFGAYPYFNCLDLKNNASYLTVAPNCPAQTSLSHTQATYTELPFPPNSFDTIIMPHILEFASKPKTIMTETWQTLAPEGHLIIIGFNPWSFNNLWHFFDKTKINLPAWATFYSASKIYQWLRNDYYEIAHHCHFHYLPLSTAEHHGMKWMSFEKLANGLLLNCGSLYLLVLKKSLIPLTPLRTRWHWRELFSHKEQLTGTAAGNVHRQS